MEERKIEQRTDRPVARAIALLCLGSALCCRADPGQDNGRSSEGTTPAAADTIALDFSALDSPAVDSSAGVARAPGAPAGSAPIIHDSVKWTTGAVNAAPRVDGPPLPVLTDLRTGIHPEYERMTVELRDARGVPGYHVEYVDRPLIECGSGRAINPVGDAWLELRLEPAAAHTEAGEPTLGSREVIVGSPLIRRIYRTCDFEGVVTLVLALSAPNPYRVHSLTHPYRIVIDVSR